MTTTISKFYHELEVLNDESILNKIKNHENLDFTGHDENENGSSTPLTYAIYNNKKELFDLLIESSANINYGTKIYDWTPLTYALRSKDTYYLTALLENPKIDLYHKAGNSNYLSHLMSIQNYHAFLNDKEFKTNVDLFVKAIKRDKNFDQKKFETKELFEHIWPHALHYKALIKNLPNSILKEAINKKVNFSLGFPHVALKVFEYISNDRLLLKKATKQLISNETLDNEGNTLLHYYVLKNYKNAERNSYKNKVDEPVVKALIDAGFDPSLKNNIGQNVIDKIKNMSFFEEWEKSFLEKNLMSINDDKKKKIKI